MGVIEVIPSNLNQFSLKPIDTNDNKFTFSEIQEHVPSGSNQ